VLGGDRQKAALSASGTTVYKDVPTSRLLPPRLPGSPHFAPYDGGPRPTTTLRVGGERSFFTCVTHVTTKVVVSGSVCSGISVKYRNYSTRGMKKAERLRINTVNKNEEKSCANLILLGCSQAKRRMPPSKKLGREKDKNMKAKTAVEAVMETVAVRVGMNRQHGWGQDDSVAAILAVFECETGDKPDEEVVPRRSAMVVNPSAFRQVLEKEKRADGQTILAKSEKVRQGKSRTR
jgi:hypothetical protein